MFRIPDEKIDFIIHEVIYIANDLLIYSQEHATEEEKVIIKRYIARLVDIRRQIMTSIESDGMERY